MKRITCRTHGGTFLIEPKRGRPPVKCSDDNPCSEHPAIKVPTPKEAKRRTPRPSQHAVLPETLKIKNVHREPTDNIRSIADVSDPSKHAKSPVEVSIPDDPSVTKAIEAKGLLEAQGWTCHARIEGASVEFHASRGTERIAMVIADGVVVSQEYTLWDTQKPSTNGVPAGRVKLPFDPDEMTDAELARALRERTVIWWNRIAKGEERATCPAKIQISHTFNGHDDEVPGDRLITFVDMHGGGFRTFRQGALMRLDK